MNKNIISNIAKINKISFKEGWGIFQTDGEGFTKDEFEIQKVDEDYIFASDEEVINFVVDSAIKNASSIYGDAIRLLEQLCKKTIGIYLFPIIGEEKWKQIKQIINH